MAKLRIHRRDGQIYVKSENFTTNLLKFLLLGPLSNALVSGNGHGPFNSCEEALTFANKLKAKSEAPIPPALALKGVTREKITIINDCE